MHKIVFAGLFSLASSLSLGTPATSLSADAISDSSSTTFCPDIFESIAVLPPEQFDYPTDILQQSIPSTLIASVATMTGAQLIRHLTKSDSVANDPLAALMYDSTFWKTLPVDVMLTLLSHAIALGHSESLKSFMEGKTFGPKFEFWTRTLSASMLSTAVITTGWALFNTPVTPTTVCSAAGLCAFVYPTIFTIKNFLFKWFPANRDRQLLNALHKDNEHAFDAIFDAAMTRAQSLGVERRQAEAMVISSFEGAVTGYKPYEDLISERSDLLKDRKVALLVEKLKALDAKTLKNDKGEKQDLQRLHHIMRLRRHLISRLLQIYRTVEEGHKLHTDISVLLRLSDQHTDDYSIQFHQALDQRARAHWLRIFGASLIDQAIAVGVAGGYFLYELNKAAAYGQAPWYFSWIFNI